MTKIFLKAFPRAVMEDRNITTNIRPKHIIISINEDKDNLAKILPASTCLSIHYQIFNDIDNRKIKYSKTLKIYKSVLFNEHKALEILDFVNEHVLDIRNIFVHCHAGVSRSVAVVSALSKILNNKDDELFNGGCPNMLVYLLLLEGYFHTENNHLRWPNIWKIRKSNLYKRCNKLDKYKPNNCTKKSIKETINNKNTKGFGTSTDSLFKDLED